MPSLVRKCTQCGAIDDRRSWKSPDDAAQEGAFEGTWTCSSCAWTEFELVELDADAARSREQTATR